eukprot:SAG31_NODE_9297_length_1302_cov_1.492103_1_plen_214_part_10
MKPLPGLLGAMLHTTPGSLFPDFHHMCMLWQRISQREDVRNALKQLGREWSKAGEGEREQVHTPLLQALERYCPVRHKRHEHLNAEAVHGKGLFPGKHVACLRPRPFSASNDTATDSESHTCNTNAIDYADATPAEDTAPLVLVPGAALGRLAADIGSCGYRVQACEYAKCMAAVATSLLEHRPLGKFWRVHPFVHDGTNRFDAGSQARTVTVP